MRITGAVVLALSLGATVTSASGPAFAKGKSKAKAAGKADGGSAPAASSAEVNKLKAVRLGDPKAGIFKWGMSPEQVIAEEKGSIEARYQPKIAQASQDPGKQQRLRDQMDREVTELKKSYTKFEGQKSGWDVSIIGPEFQQNTAEAVLVTKEDLWTRYFFFFEDRLYKMFLAFNKDAIAGKSFGDFAKSMEAKYGHAKAVYRDEKTKGGVRHLLDHYEWSAAGGDRLKLVDRSDFYGVYCLVLMDGNTNERVVEKRNVVNPGSVQKDALVESVTGKDSGGKDSNDDIIDRVTGHEVKKPGDDDQHGNIVVPSPGKGAGPKEVNAKAPAAAPEKEESAAPSNKKKGGKKSDNPMDGLEL